MKACESSQVFAQPVLSPQRNKFEVFKALLVAALNASFELGFVAAKKRQLTLPVEVLLELFDCALVGDLAGVEELAASLFEVELHFEEQKIIK